MRDDGKALAIAMLVAVAGCSHTYRFEHTDAARPASFPKLAGRALALDLGSVPATFDADANGHHFTIVDLRERTDNLVRRIFADEKVVAERASADVLLKLTLDLRMGSTFGGVSCTAVARWEISGREARASAEATETSSVGAIANGGRNCEIATIGAVAASLDASISRL